MHRPDIIARAVFFFIDIGQASIAAVQVIALGVAVSIPLAVLGVVFAPNLLGVLGASHAIIDAGQGFTAILRILSGFGGAAVAGYTIAVRLVIFALLPSWGMGNAAATLVGQNLGAGKPTRAERSVWMVALSNLVFLASVAIVFHVFAQSIAGIFSDEPDVVSVAAECLSIVAYSYPALAFGMVMVAAFNGAGDTTTPTWINFGCYWLLQIPLAYTLSTPLGLGPTGVFVTIAIAQATLAAVGITLFRRGAWKLRVV